MKSRASFFIIRWRGKGGKIFTKHVDGWLSFILLDEGRGGENNWSKAKSKESRSGECRGRESMTIKHLPWSCPFWENLGRGRGVEAHGMLFKLLGTYLSFGTWIEDLSRQEKSHIPNHGCCPCFEVLGFMTDSSSFVCVLCDALASVAVSNWELSINFQFTTKVGAKTSLDPSYFVL